MNCSLLFSECYLECILFCCLCFINTTRNHIQFACFFLSLLFFSNTFTHLNSFDIREDPEGSWGTMKKDGKFTGLPGFLQREDADIGLPTGLLPNQTEVVHYIRIHISNGLGFVTLNPAQLPQHLVLLRPYEGKYEIRTIPHSS